MDVLKTLQQLNACFGPSGCEAQICDKIERLARPFADDIYTDVMGNLIVVKHVPDAPRLMFAAHMDSIGLIVTYIEDCGLLRFGAVGGVSPRNIVATPVRFANGTVGTIGLDGDAEKPEIDKMFIDIGASDRKSAEALVQRGDMAVYDTPVRALGTGKKPSGRGRSAAKGGQYIVSPYADNRAGCVAQLIALEKLKNPVYDCYFVFTVQEEVGLRGAQPAAFGIDPKYAIVCDTTLTDDIPNSKHNGTSVLGGGASIKVMDKSVICHPEMVDMLRKIAKRKGIACQTDVIKMGGTDGSPMRKNARGVYTGGVSVPTRYIHSPQEVCCAADVEAAGALMAAFAETEPQF